MIPKSILSAIDLGEKPAWKSGGQRRDPRRVYDHPRGKWVYRDKPVSAGYLNPDYALRALVRRLRALKGRNNIAGHIMKNAAVASEQLKKLAAKG